MLGRLLQRSTEVRPKGAAHYLLVQNAALARSLRTRWARWQSRGRRGTASSAATRRSRRARRPAADGTGLFGVRAAALLGLPVPVPAERDLPPRSRSSSRSRSVQLDPLTRGSLFHEIQTRRPARAARRRDCCRCPPPGWARRRRSWSDVATRISASHHDRLAPAIERVWDDEIALMHGDLRAVADAARAPTAPSGCRGTSSWASACRSTARTTRRRARPGGDRRPLPAPRLDRPRRASTARSARCASPTTRPAATARRAASSSTAAARCSRPLRSWRSSCPASRCRRRGSRSAPPPAVHRAPVVAPRRAPPRRRSRCWRSSTARWSRARCRRRRRRAPAGSATSAACAARSMRSRAAAQGGRDLGVLEDLDGAAGDADDAALADADRSRAHPHVARRDASSSRRRPAPARRPSSSTASSACSRPGATTVDESSP